MFLNLQLHAYSQCGGWLASVFFCLSMVQKSSSRDQDEVKSSRRSALLWHVSYLTYTVLLLFLVDGGDW